MYRKQNFTVDAQLTSVLESIQNKIRKCTTKAIEIVVELEPGYVAVLRLPLVKDDSMEFIGMVCSKLMIQKTVGETMTSQE